MYFFPYISNSCNVFVLSLRFVNGRAISNQLWLHHSGPCRKPQQMQGNISTSLKCVIKLYQAGLEKTIVEFTTKNVPRHVVLNSE